MPKLNNFFDKTETVEKILTKKMHPQLVSIKNLEESKLQYRDIPQEDVGVVSAGMRFAGFEYSHSIDETTLQITGVVMYLLLIGYLTWDSLRAKKQG